MPHPWEMEVSWGGGLDVDRQFAKIMQGVVLEFEELYLVCFEFEHITVMLSTP